MNEEEFFLREPDLPTLPTAYQIFKEKNLHLSPFERVFAYKEQCFQKVLENKRTTGEVFDRLEKMTGNKGLETLLENGAYTKATPWVAYTSDIELADGTTYELRQRFIEMNKLGHLRNELFDQLKEARELINSFLNLIYGVENADAAYSLRSINNPSKQLVRHRDYMLRSIEVY